MNWFRYKLRKNRIFILTLLAVNVFNMVEGNQFVYAHQAHQQKEERLKEISELLDLPVEKLRPDHDSLFESLQKVIGVEPEDPVKAAMLERLQEVLHKHEEELASNPYLPQIEAVKREHQIHRIEGMIRDLMQLTQPAKVFSVESQKAILRNLHHGIKEQVELPPLPEGMPAKAQVKHAEMQAKLDRIFDSVRPIIASAQDAENMQSTVAQKVEQLRLYQAVETRSASRSPRFVDRPLPLRRVEKKARTLEVSALGQEKTNVRSSATPPARSAQKILKDGIAPEIAALAESLGHSPARILAWVYDNISFDPKWGGLQGPSRDPVRAVRDFLGSGLATSGVVAGSGSGRQVRVGRDRDLYRAPDQHHRPERSLACRRSSDHCRGADRALDPRQPSDRRPDVACVDQGVCRLRSQPRGNAGARGYLDLDGSVAQASQLCSGYSDS